MSRTLTVNQKSKNEQELIARFQELVNLLYTHFGVSKPYQLYQKLIAKGYSFKEKTFTGQLKSTATPSVNYINNLIKVAQNEGFKVDTHYIQNKSNVHGSLLISEEPVPTVEEQKQAEAEEPKFDFCEGETLNLGEEEKQEAATEEVKLPGTDEPEATCNLADAEPLALEETESLVLDEAETLSLDDTVDLEIPPVEEILGVGKKEPQNVAEQPAPAPETPVEQEEPEATSETPAEQEEPEVTSEAPAEQEEPLAAPEPKETTAVTDDATEYIAEATDKFMSNIPRKMAKALTAREKWELAAADYDLEYDPDEMMAKDSDGLIHLFAVEKDKYVQKIFPKGTKISRLGTARPQQVIEYANDKQVFRMAVSVICTKMIEVEANSEMSASARISDVEMIRIKHFLETKDFEVSRPLIKCIDSYMKQ